MDSSDLDLLAQLTLEKETREQERLLSPSVVVRLYGSTQSLKLYTATNDKIRVAQQLSLQAYINNNQIRTEFGMYTSLYPAAMQDFLRKMRVYAELASVKKLPIHWRSFYREVLGYKAETLSDKEVKTLLDRVADAGETADSVEMIAYWFARMHVDKRFFLSRNWRPCLYSAVHANFITDAERKLKHSEYVAFAELDRAIMNLADAADLQAARIRNTKKASMERVDQIKGRKKKTAAPSEMEIEERVEDLLTDESLLEDIEEEELDAILSEIPAPALREIPTFRKTFDGSQLRHDTPAELVRLHGLWSYTNGRLPRQQNFFVDEGPLTNLGITLDAVDNQAIQQMARVQNAQTQLSNIDK